jgi:NAD(P)-dependent dehydrogenase (short-subunit alcohol dehydrogenase family)
LVAFKIINLENIFSLEGKIIVVTGATGVLGQAFINGIADAGGIVAVLGRNRTVAEERTAAINNKGRKAIVLIADVTNEEQLKAARDKVLSAYGKIDGLVNAAGGNQPGAVLPPEQDLFNLNMKALQQVMQLNLFGTLLPSQIFGEAIKNNGGGSIINISSMSSQQAITRVLGYSLSKAAIDCYTRWFATELAIRFGDAIRMNAIAPGFFLTEQNRSLLTNADGSFTERAQRIISNTPYKRLGNAEELIGALVWLLSDASKFVTGTVTIVDGGFSAYSGV